MKFSFARMVAILAFAGGLATLPCAAQTAPHASQQTAPAVQPKSQVIFSRSTDENGQTTTQTGPAATLPPSQEATAPLASDAERQAVTFTALDLDVRLRTVEQHIAVRARLTVRNDGSAPLARIPLEISSSLNWERIRVGGDYVPYTVVTLNSDADHTGQLHEAAVPLAQPLAPGQSLQLDVTYSGAIAANAQRLVSIGTPEAAALHSDWDQIGVSFTGLRGFGNVVWYPVASLPVLLGDGARLFDEMDEHKLRLSGAHFRLRLTVEFPHGQAPTVALINGQSVPLTVTESNGLDQGQEVDGVATASLDNATLGFDAPSLFVAIRTPHPGSNLTAWTLPEDDISVQFWTTAATAVTPFLQSWLGQKPRSPLTLLDLPDSQDAPYETGSLLAAPLSEPKSPSHAEGLNGVLVYALARAWVTPPSSPRPQPAAWLDEGVAQFMNTLWVEKQHGREQALGTLEAARAALALAEPESPGQSAGQPLAVAISPVYYRTKAAYVLWMLRDLVGDDALSAALRGYDSSPTATPAAASVQAKPAVRSAFERQLEAAEGSRDLSWFFADWVDADKGLPEITIDGVFPNAVQSGNWLVAVNLTNNGYAQAELPVTVRSAAASVTQRLRVPARGKAVQRILIQGKPTEVQVNDGIVPETQASVHITKLTDPAATTAGSSQSNQPQP